MEIRKKNPIKIFDNKLGKLDQEELDIRNRLSQIEQERKNLLNQRKNAGIKKYMSRDKRNELLNEGKDLGFSLSELKILEYYNDHWNQDTITNDAITDFDNLEKYVIEQAPYKTNLLYRLGNIYHNGGKKDEN